ACVRRMTNGVPQCRVARSQRRGGYLAAPGEGRTARFRRRADKGAASHVTAEQSARFEFAIRADHCRPADPKPLGKLALGWQTRPGRKLSACDCAFEK